MDEFTKIITKGTIDRSKKIFFPAKTLNGKNGFFIASLLTDNHNNQYLIDEGWFEYNKLDYFKNNSDIISAEILGYLRYPTEKKMFTPKNSPRTNEWYYYDLKEIQKYFQIDINQKFFIKNMTNYSEKFLLPSTPNHNFSNNHLQYAITWFLMSFSIKSKIEFKSPANFLALCSLTEILDNLDICFIVLRSILIYYLNKTQSIT